MRILVVEDDLAIGDLIEINLQMSGYEVLKAIDGEEAKEVFDKEDIDLVLLDVMLPKIDGFQLIKYIKKKDIPVIFLTAKNSVIDKVKGLRLGADDYIVKPFENIELLARIEVVERRYNKDDKIIKFKNIEVDINKRIVKLNGDYVELTLKEFQLLLLFIKNKNIALSREQILNKVWGYDYVGETRTVDIHVNRLREKLDLRNNIKTIFKVGYRLQE
ncbi:response regulator transcription factor [Clostridium botulinum]|uniref:Stage 0 sporulation protein A homolog n=1 Tax=Clostridium botulinum TaxID=1491 RepID=A0A9Q1ZAT6_CLOBO|nr:response regulator transcription factor [Clostridium botulinum]AEB74759.1 two component transcriptional regulator, winged helix family [Clostridium botulinum BKT015925]KEI01826.1 response regulator [Clostridium botulinum C/D str. Sp77]KEI02792.1 response regulator [Clostridium botulinum D str. 16868]KLU76221.1 response regulator [Clostridium botulinum V891]KOA74606.1 response regulator [Clostridium botulinum]